MSRSHVVNSGLNEEQALAIWESLRKAIKEIQNGNASQLRFEELYRNAYTLVLHKYGELLYVGVSECVQEKLQEISRAVASARNEHLLETIVIKWEEHKLIMTMIRDILMYMDKTYCRLHKKVPVYDQGLLLFQAHVVRNEQISGPLKAMLLQNIYNERIGEQIDRVLMKNCLKMLVEVAVSSREVYVEDFETEFLLQTRNFYRQESQDFISRNTVPDYLRKIEERLKQEENRADTYLDPLSKNELLKCVQEELINQYAKRLVENEASGCREMFTHDQIDDLGRMYSLFSRVPATLDFVRNTMSGLIRETGTAIVKDEENLKNPKVFVQQVLDCRHKYNSIVELAFQSDRKFVVALKESLEYFINLDSRAAQYLSLYIDDMLKNGLKGVPEQEIENRLKNVISIFRYLQDKDVFEDFYKQHLAHRLLSGQSANADLEKLMISKLKAECGHQFTSRLEGMFRDMELSKEHMSGFTRHIQHAQLDTELDVTVLTTGFWPGPQVKECKLPQQADQVARIFTNYYLNVHNGRRLTWQTNLGTAELRCKFDKGRKELVVHTYQMCILMLFNKADTYTYQQIRDLTQIPEMELQRHLLSLAHPEVKVLKKNPNTKSIEPNHTFTYNTGYTSKLYRVKIKLLAASTVASSKPTVPQGVVEARKNRVEAAIVRIMKSRKTLDHNNLIAEVVKQLSSSFTADPAFIKNRIESLMEREYLERDHDNRRIYHYLA